MKKRQEMIIEVVSVITCAIGSCVVVWKDCSLLCCSREKSLDNEGKESGCIGRWVIIGVKGRSLIVLSREVNEGRVNSLVVVTQSGAVLICVCPL